jgi:PAS domain S-box-containing protein
VLLKDLTVNNLFAEFRNIEQKLRHLTFMAEEVSDGIIVVDVKGTIRFVNKAIAQMHGYSSAKSLVGKPIGVLHTKEQMAKDVRPMIEEVKRRGQISGPAEHLRNNGTVFPTKIKMTLLKYGANRIVGLILFVTDLTKEKEFRKSLTKKDSELETFRKHFEQQKTENQKAEEFFRKLTSKLTSSNKHLQKELESHKQREEQLKEYYKQFEEQIEQVINESATSIEQLQQQITESRQREKDLSEQISELTAVNRDLQEEVRIRYQAINQLEQQHQKYQDQKVKLLEVNEQIKQTITEHQQTEKKLKTELALAGQQLSILTSTDRTKTERILQSTKRKNRRTKHS